jgi:hypothetical protein
VPDRPAPAWDSGWEVPTSSALTLAPRRSKYAACVFVIDEGPRLAAQLERMRPLAEQVDIVIADGGSTDGSVAPRRLRAAGVNTLLVKHGTRQAERPDADGAGLLPAARLRGRHPDRRQRQGRPRRHPRLRRALDDGCDHVQGSRFVPGGRAIRTPWSRLLAITLVHAPLVSLAAGFRYTDTTNGFRAYSRRLLLDPRVAPFRDVFARYELHYYLAIRAARLGFDVRELPVTRAYPGAGEGPHQDQQGPRQPAGPAHPRRRLPRAVRPARHPDGPRGRGAERWPAP